MKELSMHILDLLENSTKANANKVILNITINTHKDIIEIEIIDNGKGIPKEKINKLFDPFYTTRTTRRVGLGLPLIKQTALSCNGDVVLQSELNKGTRLFFYMQYSHIDRPPMGDLITTILSFIIGNKNIDFYYKHCYNKKCFNLNTGELLKQLDGDLSMLDNPDVYNFLHDYILENLTLIYGGKKDEIFS